jgi:hypothetical protein
MNQWAFVIAAYAVTFAGTGGLIAWALAGMRRAEEQAERLRDRR